MWRLAAALPLCVLSLDIFAAPASAIPVHIAFAGEVTYARPGNPIGLFGTVGTPITGYLEYDTDTLTAPPGSSSYQLSPPGLLGLAVPGDPRSLPFVQISISNSIPGDPIYTGFPDTWSAGSTPVSYEFTAVVRLSDDTQTKVTSPAYFTPTSLAGWSRGEVFLSSTTPGPPVTFSTITLSSWTGVVPEPSAPGLIGAAALFLLGGRRALAR